TINPATGQPYGTLRGGLLYAGVNGASSTPYNSDWNNIQPRVGVTYRVTDWISARGNYGRSYLGLTACCFGVQQDGVSQTTNIITAGTPNGQAFSFRNPDFQVPYSDQWLARVNLELPGHMRLAVAYAGTQVDKLPV